MILKKSVTSSCVMHDGLHAFLKVFILLFGTLAKWNLDVKISMNVAYSSSVKS